MDKQQAIYLSILRAFRKQHIEFAYPTQTLLTRDIINTNYNAS